MSILPSRPLPLSERALARRRRKNALVLGFLGLMSALFLYVGARGALDIVEDWQIWKRGQEVRLLSLHGKVESTSRLGLTLLYDYKLDATYVDPSGARRTAKVSFRTMLRPVDQSHAATLRAALEDPNHPIVSWAIESGPWRVAEPVFFLLLTIGCVALVTAGARQAKARELLIRASADDGDEVLLPLVSSAVDKGHWTVRYETAPGVFRNQQGPDAPLIVVRNARQHVVALRSPRGGEPWLVPADLSVFDLSQEQRDAVLLRSRERA